MSIFLLGLASNATGQIATNPTEDFETGDFSKLPWEHDGDDSWTTTSQERHSGTYSAQAGAIEDNGSTTLQVTLDCVSGNITFYRKVSSESGFDYLRFYIDGVEKDKWSGEKDWTQVSFSVAAGTRTFEWTYEKDGSESEGEDTAWIDDIVFPQQSNHPFLIVTESNYPALRALAEQSPWSQMKANAISNVRADVSKKPATDYKKKVQRMGNIVSAGALAYILDPPNSSTYVSMVYDTMVNHWPDLWEGLDKSEHSHTVPPGSAFFRSVLALDIMYNDLTSAQRTDIEAELQQVANWYNANNTSWRLNLYGVRGIWALYKGDRSGIDKAKSDYRNELFSQLTADGVYNGSMTYAGARLGATRFAKSYFMDVLEFTGEDNNYYSDSTIQAFMEWLYGYSITPFRLYYTFGDTSPRGNSHKTGPGQYRVHRFSAEAQKYAAWNNDGWTAPGRLLYYLFMTKPFPQPQRAPSRIFPDGGAWFIEAGDSESALAGALWNCRSVIGHAHKDVDAIHLAAYGEHVLRNSGYCNWGNGAFGFSWDYIHNYAESSNTVLINGADHAAKVGAGITEGFTAPCFDYASGDSGNALWSNGYHQRNFLFIHPCDSVNGYWVLIDEVDAEGIGRRSTHTHVPVNVVLHPNSDDCTIVSADREYMWKIGPYTYSGHDVYLSIFLGTAPASTSVKDGLLASGGKESFVGPYLYSTYDTDDSGLVNIVTVLFPHDSSHAKATMTRISGTGYTGASIVQDGGSFEDIALESSGTNLVTYNGVSFMGLAAWYRLEYGLLTSYFVRKGQSLDDGFTPRVGFEALNDVSIYLDGMAGRIISPGTLVTFYYPGIVGVSLGGGSPLSNISSGTNWVQVNIPSGTHEIEFNT